MILANGGVLASEGYVSEDKEVGQRYMIPTVLPDNRLKDDAAAAALRACAAALQPERP